MRAGLTVAVLLLSIALGATVANADDWTAARLRGTVLQLIDGDWQRLGRGDVVPDDRVIRTVQGRVTLARGEETIELGPNTQIQIFDEGGRRSNTTVKQYFGKVQIEAEVQDVQHFSVETPYLVAAVKGTRFTVTSAESASEVRVMRGAVSVAGTESGTHTLIVAGQSAVAHEDDALVVAGAGDLPDVVDVHGNPIETGDVPEDGKGKGKGKDKDKSKDKSGSGPGSDGKKGKGKKG